MSLVLVLKVYGVCLEPVDPRLLQSHLQNSCLLVQAAYSLAGHRRTKDSNPPSFEFGKPEIPLPTLPPIFLDVQVKMESNLALVLFLLSKVRSLSIPRPIPLFGLAILLVPKFQRCHHT